MKKLEITAFLALLAAGFLVNNESIASPKNGSPCTATSPNGHKVTKGTYSTEFQRNSLVRRSRRKATIDTFDSLRVSKYLQGCRR